MLGAAARSFLDIKHGIFTRTKTSLWKLYLAETTTFTHPPADEFERPEEIREIKLNMPEALDSRQKKTALSPRERLSKSLFGQMQYALNSFDERSLRRSFVHMQDEGQPRAFFVKLTEGVDDHGGPYRAVFQTAVGEEPQQLLDLLVPCDNSSGEVGDNRDKLVFSPSLIGDEKSTQVNTLVLCS